MRRLGLIALSLGLVAYMLAWTQFAIIMLFLWEWPRNWIGWTVILANPFFLTMIAILIERHRSKGRPL